MRFKVQSSPHIHTDDSVHKIMFRVLLALVPALAFSCYVFGLRVLLVYLVSTVTACISDLIVRKIRKQDLRCMLPAMVTAILFTMILPPTIPFSLVVIGTAFSIFVGRDVFGGLGSNIFNPALVGRVFLQAAFPVAMTTWKAPSEGALAITGTASSLADALSSATPLALMKNPIVDIGSISERIAHEIPYITNMFLGNTSGTIGETSFILLLAGGLFLLITKTIDYRVPLGMALSLILLSAIFFLIDPSAYSSPLFHLLSGGFAIGALFMATDMVTSPITNVGNWVYAFVIGALVILFRLFSGLPEGVMFAILIGNALTPLINKYSKPRVYGVSK